MRKLSKQQRYAYQLALCLTIKQALQFSPEEYARVVSKNSILRSILQREEFITIEKRYDQKQRTKATRTSTTIRTDIRTESTAISRSHSRSRSSQSDPITPTSPRSEEIQEAPVRLSIDLSEHVDDEQDSGSGFDANTEQDCAHEIQEIDLMQTQTFQATSSPSLTRTEHAHTEQDITEDDAIDIQWVNSFLDKIETVTREIKEIEDSIEPRSSQDINTLFKKITTRIDSHYPDAVPAQIKSQYDALFQNYSLKKAQFVIQELNNIMAANSKQCLQELLAHINKNYDSLEKAPKHVQSHFETLKQEHSEIMAAKYDHQLRAVDRLSSPQKTDATEKVVAEKIREIQSDRTIRRKRAAIQTLIESHYGRIQDAPESIQKQYKSLKRALDVARMKRQRYQQKLTQIVEETTRRHVSPARTRKVSRSVSPPRYSSKELPRVALTHLVNELSRNPYLLDNINDDLLTTYFSKRTSIEQSPTILHIPFYVHHQSITFIANKHETPHFDSDECRNNLKLLSINLKSPDFSKLNTAINQSLLNLQVKGMRTREDAIDFLKQASLASQLDTTVFAKDYCRVYAASSKHTSVLSPSKLTPTIIDKFKNIQQLIEADDLSREELEGFFILLKDLNLPERYQVQKEDALLIIQEKLELMQTIKSTAHSDDITEEPITYDNGYEILRFSNREEWYKYINEYLLPPSRYPNEDDANSTYSYETETTIAAQIGIAVETDTEDDSLPAQVGLFEETDYSDTSSGRGTPIAGLASLSSTSSTTDSFNADTHFTPITAPRDDQQLTLSSAAEDIDSLALVSFQSTAQADMPNPIGLLRRSHFLRQIDQTPVDTNQWALVPYEARQAEANTVVLSPEDVITLITDPYVQVARRAIETGRSVLSQLGSLASWLCCSRRK